MELYEYELQKTKQKSKYRKGEAIVDEDGFTLVTRGGAYGKTLGGEVAVASKKFQDGGGKRHRTKKNKEKEGFYAFQKAEKQRKGAFVHNFFVLLPLKRLMDLSELMDLKKKWEEDKARIEQLKASRTFKPY